MLLHALGDQTTRIPPKLVVKQADLAGVVFLVVRVTQPDHITWPLVVLVVCDDFRSATDGTRPPPEYARLHQGLGGRPRKVLAKNQGRTRINPVSCWPSLRLTRRCRRRVTAQFFWLFGSLPPVTRA